MRFYLYFQNKRDSHAWVDDFARHVHVYQNRIFELIKIGS